MTQAAARTAERVAARAPARAEERRLQRPSEDYLSEKGGQLAIDPNRVPQGYVMEWKRRSVLGAVDRRNMVQLARYHWRAVPHEMQPHILGEFGKDGEDIEVGGLVLMMRPDYLNDEARDEQKAHTNDVLASQLQQIRESREAVGPANAYIKTKRVGVPDDAN